MFGNNSPYSIGLDVLAGASRPGFPPRGLFGSSYPGTPPIRATPEDEEMARRLEAQMGMSDSRQSAGSTAGTAVPPQQSNGPTLGDLVGTEPTAPKGFWQGGGKFRGRDALAGVLAAVGDAFAQQGRGGKDRGYSAMDMLLKSRNSGQEKYQGALKDYNRNKLVAALPGMTPREYAAYALDPKGWGGHMSDAASTHYQAANLNPGDQRVFGNPNMGGSVYQAPTSAEQYAGSLGETTGTPGYRTALQDYTLRGSGPTAFGFDTQLDDYRTQNDMGLENLRQRNRIGLEGVRQGNRADLRSAPTYRDLNPTAPRSSGGGRSRAPAAPTATGPNGEKVQLINNQWVPVR